MTQAAHAIPLGIRVTTYAELERIVLAFARGDLNLLILLGSHGLGKSRIIHQALPGPVCWLDGNTSVFGLYCALWRHRHQPVVLDDLDGLYASRDGVRLLKCLTQSEPVKRVSWHTDAPSLLRDEIPQKFTTTSRVVICGLMLTSQLRRKSNARSRVPVGLRSRGFWLRIPWICGRGRGNWTGCRGFPGSLTKEMHPCLF